MELKRGMISVEHQISYSCISHAGKCRTQNQDNYICADGWRGPKGVSSVSINEGVLKVGETNVLFGVFDGLGGEECGETASLLAAQEAGKAVIEDNSEEALRDLCFRMNEKICRYASEHGISSMGTTAAMLCFSDNGAALCSIGDSRIYRYRSGELVQLSVDHTGIAAYGVKPPLYQYLGIPPDEMTIDPYTAVTQYEDRDIYLICSDGLTDMLGDEQLRSILVQEGSEKDRVAGSSAKGAAGRMLSQALDQGGRDNITIILCEVRLAER